MANVDRPNGFRAVKTVSGAPVTSLIRSVGIADSADIFVGDALQLASGLAQPLAVEGQCIGVAVGFGKVDDMTQSKTGMFNPDDLGKTFYDDTANTHTDWVVFYVPSEDVIFEAQVDDTAEVGLVGEGYDIIATAGSTTTGRSAHEINGNAKTNDGDVVIVEIPNIIGNDPELAFGRYWVKFVNTEFASV